MASIGYMNRQAQLSVLNQAERMLNELDNLKKQYWNIMSVVQRKNGEISSVKKTNKFILLFLSPFLGAGICLSFIFLMSVIIPNEDGTSLLGSSFTYFAIFIMILAILLVVLVINLLKRRVRKKQKELAQTISKVHPEAVRVENIVKAKADDIARYYNNYHIPRELSCLGDLIYVRDYLAKFPEKSLGDACESLKRSRQHEEMMRKQRLIEQQLQANIVAINANTQAVQAGFRSVNETIRNSELGIRITLADYLR